MDSLYGGTLIQAADTEDLLEPRVGVRSASVAWVAWVAVALSLTVGPLLWHIEYFGKLGDEVRWAIAGVLVAQVVFAAAYVFVRRGGVWRWEPRMLLAGAVAVVAIYEPLALVAVSALFVAAYCLGCWLIVRFGVDGLGPLERVGLAPAAGLGLFCVVLFPVGLAGWYSPLTFGALLVAATGVGWRHCAELAGTAAYLDGRWRETDGFRSPLVGVAVACVPAFAGSFLAAMLAPSIAYDAISHHLPAARHYLLGGALEPLATPPGVFSGRGLFFLGHSVGYSYYPQGFEELLTVLYGLGGQAAAQMFSPITFLLSLVLLMAIGRRLGASRVACVLGVAAAATLPFAHWTGAITKNDFPLAIFELAALYAVLRARDTGLGRWMVLAGLFLGLSFGIKHTALFAAIPLALLMLGPLWRSPRKVRVALLMAMVFAGSGLFWHARTYWLTGNPLYPAQGGNAARAVPAIDGTNPSRWTVHAMYPYWAHFDGHKVLESPTHNPLGFFFLFAAPAWLLVRRRSASSVERAVLFFVLIYYLYWAFIWGVLRYAIVPIFLLALLTALRLTAAADRFPWVRRGAPAALVYCFAFALPPTLMLEVNAPQLRYLAGQLDKPGYLRAAVADYRAIEFLNGELAEGERVLSIGNCAAGYADDPNRVRCVRYVRGVREEQATTVAEAVRAWRPELVLVPADEGGTRIMELLGGDPEAPLYADELHRVYRTAAR